MGASKRLTNTKKDDIWTDVLCCVYTHVEIRDDRDGRMQLYDGSERKVGGNKLPKMAKKAYDEICDMYMGSTDCENQKKCVRQAKKNRKKKKNKKKERMLRSDGNKLYFL